MLHHLFDKCNDMFLLVQNITSTDPILKSRFIKARKDTRNAIKLTKRWIINVADIIHTMQFYPKETWQENQHIERRWHAVS